jgi:Protein of unknown function (DUF1501)
MTRQRQHGFQTCDGMMRRKLLTIGGLSAFGFGMGMLPNSAVRAAPVAGRARNCILIWLDGGPSHIETYDVKPNAPAEVRGPLDSISTSIPGFAISECLPLTASRMKDIAVIRSMTSPLGEHNLGTHYVLTGYKPTPVLEYPSFHSVGCMHREPGVLPGNIAVPNYGVGGAKFSGAGFLPQQYRPFSVGSDPAKPEFAVKHLAPSGALDLNRLDRRRHFVQQMEQLRDRREQTSADSGDSEFDRAFEMITSSAARQAFDLSDEPAAVRNKYGPRTVGQACLLARRLVESGVPFVTVNHRGWDTHESLYTRLKEGFTGAKNPVGLIPTLDLAFAALFDDLSESGLLDETLIVIAGEFGRTPKLNAAAGRDHWPRAFSVLLAGGGIRGGQVIGTTDRTGEAPIDRPITPGDLVRTIYTLLGIDPDAEIRTADGRPVRLTSPETQLISELV